MCYASHTPGSLFFNKLKSRENQIC
uniref:Uncharacterized protein n=1 Tax=Anguilla anguilla TaxID=7936 RepID=A0A0E9XNQ2_ANGAN